MEALATADAGEPLSSWLSRNHTDGSLSTISVVLDQGKAPWMPKWVESGCSLTYYKNGWKSAPASSVQLFELLRFRLCLLSRSAFFGGMRRTRVDRDRAHHPCVPPEGGSASNVRRYGGKGWSGIEV